MNTQRRSTDRTRLRAKRPVGIVAFLACLLFLTALPLAPPAAAEDLAARELVGVYDDDFTLTSDRYLTKQQVKIDDPASAQGSQRQFTLWLRKVDDACQHNVVVRITNPAGESVTQRPFRGCAGRKNLLRTTIDLPAAGAGVWTVAYRVTNGATFRIPAVRIDAFGPPAPAEPVNPFTTSEVGSGVTLLGGASSSTSSPTSPQETPNPVPTPDPPVFSECAQNEVIDAQLTLNAKLLGAYDPETGLMNDALRTFDALPTIDPYFGRDVVEPGVFAVTGENAIVDWVIVELRVTNADDRPANANPVSYIPAHKAVQVAALIQRDGDIVATDGVSPVAIPAAKFGQYRPVVWHRNHLPTAFPTFTHLGQLIDASPNWIPQGADQPRDLIPGDANNNGDVNASDRIIFSEQNGTFAYPLPGGGFKHGVYEAADFNLDGSVDGPDKTLWSTRNGTAHFAPGPFRCQPGTIERGNPFTYPDVAFAPNSVTQYSYEVIVDQLHLAPNLEGDVSIENASDDSAERSRLRVTSVLDFVGYPIENGEQWVRLIATDPTMTSTEASYPNTSLSEVDQTQPIPAAMIDSSWSESDIWADTDTPNRTLADEFSGAVYFRRDLDGNVREIIHPVSASGQASSAMARNVTEGMVNLISMDLAGTTDDFTVLEQDRSGRRPIAYTASQSGGVTTVNRTTPNGTTPADVTGVTSGSADATISVNTTGEVTSIVSTESLTLDETSDSDTIDASDPFADIAPLQAQIWSRSTLTKESVESTTPPTFDEADPTHLRTILSAAAATQLHTEAEIDNNRSLETQLRSDLLTVVDPDQNSGLFPETFELGDRARKLFTLFPDTAIGMANDAASGELGSVTAVEVVLSALGSVGNRSSQLALVGFASATSDIDLRQMAVVTMVLLENPIDEVIDYLSTIVTDHDPVQAEDWVVAPNGDVIVPNDLQNSAMLVLGSLGGRLTDPVKANEVRATLAQIEASADLTSQRVAADALENLEANSAGAERAPAAFEPVSASTGAQARPAAPRADALLDRSPQQAAAKTGTEAFPVGAPFWGHCGWDQTANDGEGGWVSGGVVSGPNVDATGGQHVYMFGHPALGPIPSDPVGLPQYNGAFLMNSTGSCDNFRGRGVEGRYYGHCVRTTDPDATDEFLWVEPEYAPAQFDLGPAPSTDSEIWAYAEFPGSVLLKNRTSAHPWGDPPVVMPWPLIFVALPPGECRVLNENQTPGSGEPEVPVTSTGEPDNEGFHWEKQIGPDFAHADLYASLDLPRSDHRGSVFRAEAGANVTVAGRTATVVRAKAESALDLIDETAANRPGVLGEIGTIERDLTLEGWFFNNKVIDREIGIPCGFGGGGELFQVPALNLGFSKTILVFGFIPVEFAGGIGANISSPWQWSADSCDIFFGSDELVTLAGNVGLEGRAEAHLTAGINLLVAKGGGGVGGTLIGFSGNAGASLQLFRPSTGLGPALCFDFNTTLIPPNISAYVWYKLLWKKKKTKNLFSWGPTAPPPVRYGSQCEVVAAHKVTVGSGSMGNDTGPTFSNPSFNGHQLALPAQAAENLINNPGDGVQLRVMTGDDERVFDTLAAFCASQGYGAPVVDATSYTDSAAPTQPNTKYAYVDGAWGYADADVGFVEITSITCANGNVAVSTRVKNPTTLEWVSANSPDGAVMDVPDQPNPVAPVEVVISNVGDAGALHHVSVGWQAIGLTPSCNGTTIPAGGSITCSFDMSMNNATGAAVMRQIQIDAASTDDVDAVENVGTFNWYTCFDCAPSGGTPGGTNPTAPGSDPQPLLGLDITKVEIKASDVAWRQDADGADTPHVETPDSVSVFITVKNTHPEDVTDLEFQGIGLNDSGTCDGATVPSQDSIECRISFVPISTGVNDRTVKAFAVSFDAVSQPVYSVPRSWRVFGEQPLLQMTSVKINGEDAVAGRPGISQDAPIVFQVTNPSSQGAVDLNDLRLTGNGLRGVVCPFTIDVGETVSCTATVEFDPTVTDTAEFTATVSADGVVSDRSTVVDTTWGWWGGSNAIVNNLTITGIAISAAGTTSPTITSAATSDTVDARITVRNDGAEPVTDLMFDLIGSANSCADTGTTVAPGASVDCRIFDVAVSEGTVETSVRAEGTGGTVDSVSDPFSYTFTGENPRIQITAITIDEQSALDPDATPGTTRVLTNLGLEEGTHQIDISILNTDAATTPGAVTVSNVSISSMSLSDVTCPPTIAPGAVGVCQATFEVWPSDKQVARAVRATATYAGDREVTDQRSWSWSYRPRFTLGMRYTSQPTPAAMALAPAAVYLPPGSYRVGVVLTNADLDGTLEELVFNESEISRTEGQSDPALTCNPSTTTTSSVGASEVIECELLVTVGTDDQKVVATATLDGITKTAEVALIADPDVEVVDVGEPPADLARSHQWGTGTGGFVITPKEGEPMPTIVNFGEREIKGAELAAFSYPDDAATPAVDWEIEIIPNYGQPGTRDEDGRQLLNYETSNGIVDRMFHVVPADEFDLLLNHRLIDVTNFTESYDNAQDAANTPFANTVILEEGFLGELRAGSVLVHSGGGELAHPEAPDGFIQVVGSFIDMSIVGGGNGQTGRFSATTQNGDLLDGVRDGRVRNSDSGALDKKSGSGGNASGELGFDVNFTSSFTPEFDIDVEWKREMWYNPFPSPVLEYLRVGAQASAGLNYTATASASWEDTGVIPILPATRLLAFPVGPVTVGVNISAQGVWHLHAEGNLTATGDVGATVSAWAEYRNTGASPPPTESAFDHNLSADFSLCEDLEGPDLEEYPIGNTCFKPSYSGRFTAEAGLDIDIALLIADQAGPKITIGPRLSMSAGFTQNGVSADLDFSSGIPLGLVQSGELENARVIEGRELDPDPTAGTANGTTKKSRSKTVAKFGVKFKGLAKRIFPSDFDFDLGSVPGRYLNKLTAVFGKVVNLCAWGRGDFAQWWNAFPTDPSVDGADVTRAMLLGWRPPHHGHPTGSIAWHGHHIVPKSPRQRGADVPEIQQLHTILEDAGIRVLSSCKNLVWAPNNRSPFFTPAHQPEGDDGWEQLRDDMGTSPSAGQVRSVLRLWSVKACTSYEDYPNNPLNGAEEARFRTQVCTL